MTGDVVGQYSTVITRRQSLANVCCHFTKTMTGKSFTIDSILRGSSPARANSTYPVSLQELAPQQQLLHDAASAYWMADPSSVFRPLWPIQNHPTAIWLQQHHSMPVDLSAASSVQRHQTATAGHHHPAALFNGSNWMPASMATGMTTGCWTTNESELLASFTHHGMCITIKSPFFFSVERRIITRRKE